MHLSGLTWITFLSFLLAASAIDLKTRKIPNWLLGAGVFLGFLLSFLHAGGMGIKLSLLGLFFGVLLLLLPFAFRLLGGGDVKLLGVIGVFLGPGGALFAFLVGSLVGGGVAVWSLLRQKGRAPLGRGAEKIPYGPALAAGGLFGALFAGFPGGAL